MEIKHCILTKNDCYKSGRKITPKGVMWHSTGANNPNLKRYIQPDDGLLGINSNGNDWNRSGTNACVHAFIGKDKNGNVQIYQTLPWNHRGWHGGGASNNTHISFEICEDSLNDRVYFNAVYQAAIYLTVYLCKKYELNPLADGVVIDHSEGHDRGIASNHGDVKHWFSRFGKTMNDVRHDVKNEMENDSMTQEQFNKFYNVVNPIYYKVSDVPEYWREDVKQLIAKGKIRGDGVNELAIREETLKAAIIANRT